MNTLVLYESQFGNTQKVAEVIGKELEAHGPVRVTSVVNYQPPLLVDVDLIVIGAPTQAHGMTPAMKAFVEKLEAGASRLPVAIFDTRVKGPMLLWGSAGRGMAAKLADKGFNVIAGAESYTVTFSQPPRLEDGEEEHARAWAEKIAGLVAAREPVTA